jgi:phage tail sheath protein FI
VYIVEAPSGVHTITGVATSIGAFFGQAAMGPLNDPINCLSYSDYTRNFGAPYPGANLAQSVQEFFSNGGPQCYVVRLAHNAQAAGVTLQDTNKVPVLDLTASSPGLWGANLTVTVDYDTPTPDSTFNLQVAYSSAGSVVESESFANLSMDPSSTRYAPTFITQSSELLIAALHGAPTSAITAGYSEARGLPPISTGTLNAALQGLWSGSSPDLQSFQISVDGSAWALVSLSLTQLQLSTNSTDAATRTYVQTTIDNVLPAGTGVVVDSTPGGFLRITSNGPTKSSVQVIPASSSDLAQPLMLGVNQGGIEVASWSDLRPVPTGIFFNPGTTGEILTAMDALAAAALSDVQDVVVNGTSVAIALTPAAQKFYVGSGGASDHDGVRENLQNIANFIGANVPGFQAGVAGYRLFVENLNPSIAPAADTFSITTNPDATLFGGGFTQSVAAYPLGETAGGPYYQPFGAAPSDGAPPVQADYTGDESQRTGFYALDSVDLFNIMVLPGDGIVGETEWGAIRSAAATYCQNRRAFLVLDAPLTWTANNLLTANSSSVSAFRALIGNPDINCAVYYPRVQINDNGTLRYIGPSGMVAGMYAATDASRGVWKAPAGTNAALTGVNDLEVILTDKQNGILNPLGVNCLRRMPAGYLIWGARTVAGYDDSGTDWTYVPVRRMALFLEESLYRGTQWAVFEPNAEPLWAQIRMNINAFMMGLFQQGAFAGTTPSTAFFVKCDSETTTQSDIDQGIVNIIVGFAPLEPAEFVVITIQQIIGTLS